jgi:hypothetical protein
MPGLGCVAVVASKYSCLKKSSVRGGAVFNLSNLHVFMHESEMTLDFGNTICDVNNLAI